MEEEDVIHNPSRLPHGPHWLLLQIAPICDPSISNKVFKSLKKKIKKNLSKKPYVDNNWSCTNKRIHELVGNQEEYKVFLKVLKK